MLLFISLFCLSAISVLRVFGVVQQIPARLVPASPIAHLYFIGQLMKHLPDGFGAWHTIGSGHRASLAEWVASMRSTCVITAFAIWISQLHVLDYAGCRDFCLVCGPGPTRFSGQTPVTTIAEL